MEVVLGLESEANLEAPEICILYQQRANPLVAKISLFLLSLMCNNGYYILF